jgi:hypothetical protein
MIGTQTRKEYVMTELVTVLVKLDIPKTLHERVRRYASGSDHRPKLALNVAYEWLIRQAIEREEEAVEREREGDGERAETPATAA